MKKIIILTLVLFVVLIEDVRSQQNKLLPAAHGLRLIFGDASKEEIINYVKFADGSAKDADILRFDNAGAGEGIILPLIISTKEAIKTDELGLISLELASDTLEMLFDFVLNCDDKIYKRPAVQYGLIKITYRLSGRLEQYYITDLKSSTKLFKEIEKFFIKTKNKAALRKLYFFLSPSTLIEGSKNGIIWRY